MKGFKFLILFLIFELTSVFSQTKDHTLDSTYVCLYDTDCYLRFKRDLALGNPYITFSGDCTKNKTTDKIDLVPNKPPNVQNLPSHEKFMYYKAVFTPETKYKPSGLICLDKPNSNGLYLEKKFIKLGGHLPSYAIDDNNDLGIIFSHDQTPVNLVISDKYEYENPSVTRKFVTCGNKIVSYANLNKLIHQSKPFGEVFVFLLFSTQTNNPTFLFNTTVFNHSNISSFDHKVVDNKIVAEIQFKNPELFKQNKDSLFSNDQFFLSAQSAVDIEGLSAKCGNENLQWKIQNIPYKISDKGIVFLLPLSLYGKTVRICASFKGDKSEEYKIPLYSFEVNDKTSGYFKNILYSNPLGITEITLNSDFHPLSEIMLVYACDLENNSTVPRSLFNTYECNKNFNYKIDYNKLLSDYDLNLSYNAKDLYSSLYSKNALFDDFIPHKLVYLPDKSAISDSGTKWIKEGLFLPRLYMDTLHPYVILACDRWKNTFCFAEDQFDSVVGIVYPSKRSFLEFTAKWENEDMLVEIKTRSSEKFLLKLIMSRNTQYTDYQSICNNKQGVYPRSYIHSTEEPGNHINTFKGLTLGKIYYVCLINIKERNELPQKINKIYSEQTNLSDKILDFDVKFDLSWDFIGVINTQTPLSSTHFLLNRHEDMIKVMVPTTGFLGATYSMGLFFPNDFSATCKIQNPEELTSITASPNEYSSFITFVKENDTYKERINEYKAPEGFWLSNDERFWFSFGNYISYLGEFTPKNKIYKVCACVQNACYFAGIATESKIESFELNQVVNSNDFYDRFIFGGRICFYNKSKLSCFTKTDDLETSFIYPFKINVPQIQLNHVSFDEANDVMCLLSPNSVYVYEDFPEPRIIITGIHNMEMMFSFSDATFFVSSEHVYVSTGQSIIADLISKEISGSPEIKTKTIKFSKDLEKLGSIEIPVNHNIKNVYISKELDKFYSCFLIDENLLFAYYKIELDFTNKKHFAQKVDVIDVKEFFPGVKNGVRFSVSSRILADKVRFIIFLTHQEFNEIKVFYLDGHKIINYSSVRSILGTIDIMTTNTHIMSLNAISFEDKFPQYLVQIEYDNLVEVSVEYPKLTDLDFNNQYSFLPKVSNGIPLKFYIFEYIDEDNVVNEEIHDTGFKLNRLTGEIFGTCNFRGEYEVTVNVDFLLGKTSLFLHLNSRCAPGYEYSSAFGECSECRIGFYRHNRALDNCLRCEDYMANTTTRNEASSSPLDCLCKPGFYSTTKACIKCPEGKYNDELGAISCDKTCLPNQISSVVGASSREELKCVCIAGYFDKNGVCEECHKGRYCPGKNIVYNCPENTSTLGPRSTSIKDCLCNPGYELTEAGCVPCNIHSYKSTLSNEKCTLCSADTPEGVYSFTKNAGSTSKYQCRYCMPGFYHDGTSCTHCPDKSYCKGFNFDPISCGTNAIVKKGNPSSQDDCMCPEGYGFTTIALVGSTSRNCIKCPLNTFQPIDGTHGSCIKCPANTYTMKEGSTSLLDCIPLPGYFNLVDDYKVLVENIESSYHMYNEIILQSFQVQCYKSEELISPSITILRESLESCVELCKLNPYCKYAYYYKFTQFAGSSEIPKENFCSLYTTFGHRIPKIIKDTPVTIRDDNHGPVICEIFRDYVYPIFVPCPRNYYCPGGLNALKTKCPLNSVTLFEGSSSPDVCLCLPGYYPNDNVCVPCKKGTYKPTLSNKLCTKCPSNTTTSMEGSFFINQCACIKNKYPAAFPQLKSNTPTNMLIYSNTLDVHEHGTNDTNEESSDIDWLLSENIKDLVNSKLDFYCSICPYGYFCKGLWMFPKIHMPPVPCFAGSSVHFSSTNQSTNSCMCNPGYGIRPLGSDLDSEFGLECEKCLPGTFKSVHENAFCHEACPAYSTSQPGSQREEDCFCIPGFYYDFENGKFQCKKCPHGSICYGGIQNGIHTKPIPKSGFAVLVINNIRYEPPSFLLTLPQNTTPIVRTDTTRLTHPCVTPARCIGGGKCSEGSSGLLCTECDLGYDIYHFNSKCKKCSGTIKELIKIFIPRITLYALVILFSLYNKRANSTSELSLVAIFKILYTYTISLVPLGIIPSNSPSSIRKFYSFYEKFFYHPINFYAYSDRINCFRNLSVHIDAILNHLGFVKNVPKLSELNYIEIWYLQRYFGIFKLIFDIIVIFILDFTLYILNITFSIFQRSLTRRLKLLRIKIGPSNVSLSRFHDEAEIKFEKPPRMVFQHMMVLICLHLPSISLNSLSMIWYSKFPLREGYVLLHMPNQVCTFANRNFLFGAIVSASSLGFIITLLLFLFIKFRNCKYTQGWGNIFITGYRKKYRNWDVIQLIRQILIIFLVVCRYSIDSNKSEINRLLLYLKIHLVYLKILFLIKPYDSRSGFVFYNLEKYLIGSNLFLSTFIYGSYFHNFSIVSGLAFIASALSYLSIFLTLLREFITVCCVISRPKECFWRNFTLLFVSFFKLNHSLLYFNPDDDTMIFEAYNVSKKKRINSIPDSKSVIRDKTFLFTCLTELFELCESYNTDGTLSKTLIYFYIRLIIWNSRCMKIDIFSKNITKDEIIEYVLYLYLFNKKYKCFAKLFLLNYPFNTIKSHLTSFHLSKPCDETCEELQYKNLDYCFDHISSTLLVDILFEQFYNDAPLTLSEFYYSLISLSRIDESEILRIYGIYTEYLDFIRSFNIQIKITKVKLLESEINKLVERAEQEGLYGEKISEKHKRKTELENLKTEVQELNKSVEEETKKVESLGTRFSRASALKAGVEKVVSENLTNDEILDSISKLERKSKSIRQSILFSNKKRVDSIYKLKVL